MNTPCGLTQEKLDAHAGWLNVETGMCNAPFKNVNGETQRGCGELYASHPSSAQAQTGGRGEGQVLERLRKLEQRVEASADERLSYFSTAMAASSGKHSAASKAIKTKYKHKCLFCGSANPTLAHLVAGNSHVDYSLFGTRNGYKSDLDVKSQRNFIPLCGKLGEIGTCYHEFDTYKMSLLYDPLSQEYRVFCLDSKFAKYDEVNNKVIPVDTDFPPYRRLLAWRARKCVNEHACLLGDKGEQLLEYAMFSEISRSVKNDREEWPVESPKKKKRKRKQSQKDTDKKKKERV